MSRRILVLGPPGSGKSTLTQALLAEHPELGHFGVRRYFAQQAAAGTDLAEAARPYVEASRWLPDELVVEAIRRELRAGALAGDFVLEGVPATRGQASLLDDLLTRRGVPLTHVLYLEADDELCLARVALRRVCATCDGGVDHAAAREHDAGRCAACGGTRTTRADDAPEAFRRRLAMHRDAVAAVVDHYPERIVARIDASGDPDAVLAAARAALA